MPYKDPIKRRESTRLRMIKFRERHKEDEVYLNKKREQNRKCWNKNKKYYSKKHKEWYENNRGTELLRFKEYNQKTKVHQNELKKASNKLRRKTDDNFLIKSRLRCLLYNSLKLYGEGKQFSSSKYGIDFNAICIKLGPCPGERKDYHIDHIKPASLFNLKNPEEVRKCFSPNNLQWLPSLVNIKKSNKIIYQL